MKLPEDFPWEVKERKRKLTDEQKAWMRTNHPQWNYATGEDYDREASDEAQPVSSYTVAFTPAPVPPLPSIEIKRPMMDETRPNKEESQEQGIDDLLKSFPTSASMVLKGVSRYDAPAAIFRVFTQDEKCLGWESCSCGLEAIGEKCAPTCRRCRCKYHSKIHFLWSSVLPDQISLYRSQGYRIVPRYLPNTNTPFVRERVYDAAINAYVQRDSVLMFQPRSLYDAYLKQRHEENVQLHPPMETKRAITVPNTAALGTSRMQEMRVPNPDAPEAQPESQSVFRR